MSPPVSPHLHSDTVIALSVSASAPGMFYEPQGVAPPAQAPLRRGAVLRWLPHTDTREYGMGVPWTRAAMQNNEAQDQPSAVVRRLECRYDLYQHLSRSSCCRRAGDRVDLPKLCARPTRRGEQISLRAAPARVSASHETLRRSPLARDKGGWDGSCRPALSPVVVARPRGRPRSLATKVRR